MVRLLATNPFDPSAALRAGSGQDRFTLMGRGRIERELG